MKRVIAVLLCTVMLAAAMCTSAFAADKPSFVVLGDSIAQGVGSNDQDVDSYAALVAKECGYELTNRALAGDVSGAMLLKVTANSEVRKAIEGADIIEFSIGGNDFLLDNMANTVVQATLGNFEPVEKILVGFRENFDKIVKEIRSLNPDALVIVQTLYNPISTSSESLHNAFETALGMLNDCYYDYLDENPGAYIVADVHGAFIGKEETLIFKDHIHPSPEGHRLIADTLEKVLVRENVAVIIPQTGSAASVAAFALVFSFAGAAVTARKRKSK